MPRREFGQNLSSSSKEQVPHIVVSGGDPRAQVDSSMSDGGDVCLLQPPACNNMHEGDDSKRHTAAESGRDRVRHTIVASNDSRKMCSHINGFSDSARGSHESQAGEDRGSQESQESHEGRSLVEHEVGQATKFQCSNDGRKITKFTRVAGQADIDTGGGV